LKLIKLCDCGHAEKAYSIKTINDLTYCHSCWKVYQEKAGHVDAGCIFPEAEVCADREPVMFSKGSNEQMDVIKKARCYCGHKFCIKHGVDELLLLIEDRPAICPNEGCNAILKKINTKFYTTLICPVHGVILKAAIGREREGREK